MAAQQPVSFSCIFCLVLAKCRSKHKGEKKIIIAFDTRCEAEQLFVTGGQLLSSLPFQPLLSKKLSFFFLRKCEQTCGMFYVFIS